MLLDPVPDEHDRTLPRSGQSHAQRASGRSATRSARVGHPVAVEPGGDPLRELDHRLRVAAEVVGVEDVQRRGVRRGGVHQVSSQPSSSPASSRAGHEDGLAQAGAAARTNGPRWCPHSKSWRSSTRLRADDVVGLASPRRRSRSGGAGPPAARRHGGTPGHGRRAAPPSPRCRGRRDASVRASGDPSAGPSVCVRNMEGWRTTSSTTPSPPGSSYAFMGWNT